MKSVPDKDYGGDFMGTKVAFSHVVDDLQYACLVAHGGMMPYIRSHMMPQRVNRGPRISQMGWT
jgi:hypothetical protein